jgi:hypothetical protein
MFLSQRTPITEGMPKIDAYFKFLITTPLCLGGINYLKFERTANALD